MLSEDSAPMEDKFSATGTRTRVFRVRAEHPNQLDYGGPVDTYFTKHT